MEIYFEAIFAGGLKNLSGLLEAEGSLLAKDVHVLHVELACFYQFHHLWQLNFDDIFCGFVGCLPSGKYGSMNSDLFKARKLCFLF